jgi:hypothetical protein
MLQARAAGNFSRCLGAFLLAGVNVVHPFEFTG